MLTPLVALRAAILNRMTSKLARMESPPMPAFTPYGVEIVEDGGTAVSKMWKRVTSAEDEGDRILALLSEATDETRTNGFPTDIEAVPHLSPRNFESCKMHTLLTPAGRWVGFPYLSGGGKHSNPEEIDWLKNICWLNNQPEVVARIKPQSIICEEMPPLSSEQSLQDDLQEVRDRLVAMETFCKPVPTDSMAGMDVFAWFMSIMEEYAAASDKTSALKMIESFAKYPMSGLFAELFSVQFTEVGAVNYYELTYENQALGQFTVTIQRTEGVTPGNVVANLKEELIVANSQIKHWKSNHDNMVDRCNMLAQRPDLPVDRIPAFNALAKAQAKIDELEAKISATEGIRSKFYPELKKAAEAATPGRLGDRIDGSGSIKYLCRGTDGTDVLLTDHKNDEFGFVGPNRDADEKFFLLASPEAVLDLIQQVDYWREKSGKDK